MKVDKIMCLRAPKRRTHPNGASELLRKAFDTTSIGKFGNEPSRDSGLREAKAYQGVMDHRGKKVKGLSFDGEERSTQVC